MIDEVLNKFEDTFPFAGVNDYRPICHELFTDGKEGLTIWLKNGDIIEYYPKAESKMDADADKGVLEKINEKQDSLKAVCKAWDEEIEKYGYVN